MRQQFSQNFHFPFVGEKHNILIIYDIKICHPFWNTCINIKQGIIKNAWFFFSFRASLMDLLDLYCTVCPPCREEHFLLYFQLILDMYWDEKKNQCLIMQKGWLFFYNSIRSGEFVPICRDDCWTCWPGRKETKALVIEATFSNKFYVFWSVRHNKLSFLSLKTDSWYFLRHEKSRIILYTLQVCHSVTKAAPTGTDFDQYAQIDLSNTITQTNKWSCVLAVMTSQLSTNNQTENRLTAAGVSILNAL